MGRYTALLFCLVLVSVHPNASGAHPLTGQELRDYWGEYSKIQEGQEGNWAKAGMFIGYVRGVLDALEGTTLCLPDGVPVEYLVKEVALYLQEHQDRSNKNAGRNLIFDAVRGRFACRR